MYLHTTIEMDAGRIATNSIFVLYLPCAGQGSLVCSHAFSSISSTFFYYPFKSHFNCSIACFHAALGGLALSVRVLKGPVDYASIILGVQRIMWE